MSLRPPPPQGAPPSYTFVTKFYKRTLRPIVMTTAILTAIWSLFSGIGFFRNVSVYNDNGGRSLGTMSIVVGSLYMVVFGISLYGCFAAGSQKIPFVRIYAYLSALAAAIVMGISLVRVVVHFTARDTILDVCHNIPRVYVYPGWWGPIYAGPMNRGEAGAFCLRYYNRDSWSEIIALILLTGVAVFFSVLAFGYMRQLLDPSSPGNVMRNPQHSAGQPNYYYPPYGAGYNPAYGSGPQYPAPAGPPPPQDVHFATEYGGKPPDYSGAGYERWNDMNKKDRDEENRPRDGGPTTGDARY